MQIIKSKSYDIVEENTEIMKLRFVSFNSNHVLSFVLQDGTHLNFNDKEKDMIIKFILNDLKVNGR